jgi:5'-nucleotidase
MNILVTNDDGIDAIGINLLATRLRKYGNVYIVAPDKAMSGASHSFHFGELTMIEIDKISGVKCYHCNGSPVDCVRIAVSAIPVVFDVVFSGVNNGLNVGTDVLYSGTVGAAREAVIEGIPGVAISTDYDSFEIVNNELDRTLAYIFKNELYSKNYVLNVNYPISGYQKSNGTAFAKQGKKIFKTLFTHIKDGIYFQSDDSIYKDTDKTTDVAKVEDGYITFTPLKIDQTSYEALEEMKK